MLRYSSGLYWNECSASQAAFTLKQKRSQQLSCCWLKKRCFIIPTKVLKVTQSVESNACIHCFLSLPWLLLVSFALLCPSLPVFDGLTCFQAEDNNISHIYSELPDVVSASVPSKDGLASSARRGTVSLTLKGHGDFTQKIWFWKAPCWQGHRW